MRNEEAVVPPAEGKRKVLTKKELWAIALLAKDWLEAEYDPSSLTAQKIFNAREALRRKLEELGVDVACGTGEGGWGMRDEEGIRSRIKHKDGTLFWPEDGAACLKEIASLRSQLKKAEEERDALRTLLAVARRKIPFLVRDYSGDKESRKWVEDCDKFMRKYGLRGRNNGQQ